MRLPTGLFTTEGTESEEKTEETEKGTFCFLPPRGDNLKGLR